MTSSGDLERLWPDPDRRDDALTHVLVHVAQPRRDLTAAELLALKAAAAGLRWREAAVVLGVEPCTVADALTRCRRILGAKNTTHAVAIALRQGLIR